MLRLELTKRTDPRLLARMETHYSRPKGFVGRNRCFAVFWGSTYYGHIVAGSATLHLPGRNAFFDDFDINRVINNVFFSISKVDGKYPTRNFMPKVLAVFREQSAEDWKSKYGFDVMGFETLVLPPRTGEGYLRDGWEVVGTTKGYSCKRTSGTGSDSWSGKRVWDTSNPQPKLVLCRRV